MREARQSAEKPDERAPFLRDYDRILYSKEFRRLSGITQVARSGEPYIYHDRLAHSLEVAQVARSIAGILQDDRRLEERRRNSNYWIDCDIVRTAALAHDLGHPPFGHAAEDVLDDLIPDKFGGFEANAQSFRILTKISQHREEYSGLNLTRGSLNATLKYPWGINEGPRDDKWGYYPTEKNEFEWVRRHSENPERKCIEAEIMDLADDITYAVHDLEDFYKAGLIPLGSLLSPDDESERPRFKKYLNNNQKVDIELNVDDFFTQKLRGIAPPSLDTPFDGSDKDTASLNRFSSALVEQFLAVDQPEELYLVVRDGEFALRRESPIDMPSSCDDVFTDDIEILKQLTFFYVIDDSTLMSQQHGQCRIIEELFEFFSENLFEQSNFSSIVPSPYRERLEKLRYSDELERQRIIADIITSMTERQAQDIHSRLYGDSPGSLREGILR